MYIGVSQLCVCMVIHIRARRMAERLYLLLVICYSHYDIKAGRRLGHSLSWKGNTSVLTLKMEGKHRERFWAHGRVTLTKICKMMMVPGTVFLAPSNGYYISYSECCCTPMLALCVWILLYSSAMLLGSNQMTLSPWPSSIMVVFVQNPQDQWPAIRLIWISPTIGPNHQCWTSKLHTIWCSFRPKAANAGSPHTYTSGLHHSSLLAIWECLISPSLSESKSSKKVSIDQLVPTIQ